MKFFKELWQILQSIGIRFVKERFTYSASALTVTTLLALVPLMSVLFGILSLFPMFKSLGTQIQDFVFQNFVPASGQIVQQYLQTFIAQASKLSVIGMIFLVVTAIMMMLTIERSFNDVWKIEPRQYTLVSIIKYWAVLSLAPISIALFLMLTSYVVSLPLISHTAVNLGIQKVVLSALPFLLTLFVLSLLYIVVPNCKVPFWSGFTGALVATILFEIAKKAFVFYVTRFPTYRIIYGALASIPIFFVWLYFSWVIVLLGALISHVLSIHRYVKRTASIDGFTHAFLWLGFLWEAQKEGRGLRLRELYNLLPGNYEVEAYRLLAHLQTENFITVLNGDRYMLTRDFSSLTLTEFYRKLPWKLTTTEKSANCFSKKMHHLLDVVNQALDEELNQPLATLFEDVSVG